MILDSLTKRFAAWFVLVSLLPILLIGASLLHTFDTELRATAMRNISSIADKKVDQIDSYLNERRQDAVVLLQGRTTRQAMNEFSRVIDQNGMDSEAYRQLDARYRGYFKRFLESADYYDLFLISPQGAVIYTQKHEQDFATNLLTGPYRNSGLAGVTRQALTTLVSGISDFEYYAPSADTIAAFIAVPIISEGRIAGVLALQINAAHVFQVLTDNTGMGRSGETLVARGEDEHTALVMAPLRSDPDAALKRKIALNNPERSSPLVRALNGERINSFAVDYDGHYVVAASRYLPIMGWGLVVKMDASEALAPIYRVRAAGLVILGLALLTALLGAMLFGRRVVTPLRILSRHAQDIADGRLDQRVSITGRDELGKLGDVFNVMAQRLQSSHADLERQVEQRTIALTLALEKESAAQDAMQRERDFATGLINTAPVLVLLLDNRGIIQHINPYFEQLTGYRLDEVKDREWFSTFLPARDQERTRALFRNITHGVSARGSVNPIVTRNGEEREIEWHNRILCDAQGTVTGVLAVGQDVTERRSMELALRSSAERLKEAQRIAQVGSWELDLASGALLWSDEVFRLFEIDKNRFGATYEAFLDAIHPDDRDRVNQAYTNSLETRTPYEISHRLRMRDGRIKWVNERCVSDFDAEGKPLRSIGTVQDITRQKQAEELLRESEMRYHSVVTALSEGIVLTAKDGAITASNQAAEEILGLTCDQMMGRTPIAPGWRAIHEDGTPFPDETHPGTVTLRTGKPQANVIMGIHKPDGTLTWISINSQPIFQPGTQEPSAVVASFVDISARKRAEQALVQSEALYRTLAQVAPVGIFHADPSGECTYVNDQYCALTGLSHEAALGNGWSAALHADDRVGIVEAWAQSVKKQEPFAAEFRMRRPDGKVLWVAVQSQSELDRQGEVLAIVGTVIDITERHLNEEALLIKQSAIDSSLNATAMAGMDGKITYVNRAFLDMWRLERPEQALGHLPLEFIAEAPTIIEAMQRDGSWQGEVTGQRGDGSSMDIQLYGHTVLDAGGQPICLMASFLDITERKRVESALANSESLFRTLAEGAPVGIFRTNTAGICTYVNNRWCEMAGISQNAALGMGWVKAIHSEDRARILEEWSATALQHRPFMSVHRFQKTDQPEMWVVSQARPEISKDGEVLGYVGTITDITDRVRAEQALQDANEHLEERVKERTAELEKAKNAAEQANAAKSQFLSRMSHELRTPMNAILGYAQLLEIERGGEEVGAILQAGWHLLELITDLLDFTKIEQNRLEIAFGSVPVEDIIAECLATIRPIAGERRITLHNDAVACAVCLRADRTRLRQVLLNLLTNAVKYNRESGSITLSCERLPNGRARIDVTDTGAGIHEKDLPLLFQPFSRLYLDTYAVEGSGIGLALSRQLMTLMGGTLTVTSTFGRGSTFSIELAETDADARPDASAKPVAAHPPGAQQQLVLYIEDNPLHISLVRDILADRPDIQVITAGTPTLGLELAVAHRPALILLDINLPGMDGYEVMRRLRLQEVTRAIPVVALSANAMPADLERGRGAGFKEYLTKPIQVSELRKLIGRILT